MFVVLVKALGMLWKFVGENKDHWNIFCYLQWTATIKTAYTERFRDLFTLVDVLIAPHWARPCFRKKT